MTPLCDCELTHPSRFILRRMLPTPKQLRSLKDQKQSTLIMCNQVTEYYPTTVEREHSIKLHWFELSPRGNLVWLVEGWLWKKPRHITSETNFPLQVPSDKIASWISTYYHSCLRGWRALDPESSHSAQIPTIGSVLITLAVRRYMLDWELQRYLGQINRHCCSLAPRGAFWAGSIHFILSR